MPKPKDKVPLKMMKNAVSLDGEYALGARNNIIPVLTRESKESVFVYAQ